MDVAYPLVPIANFFACLFVLASLSKNLLQPRSIAVCSLAFWIIVESLTIAINSIAWSNNVDIKSPVWCDIMVVTATHLDVASEVAVPAASFAIIRRLSLTIHRNSHLPLMRRRLDIVIDLFLCVGCPIILVGLHYVVQTTRFVIVEEVGCRGTNASIGLTILLNDAAPIFFPIISLTLYAPRLVLTYYRHKKELDEALASNTNFNRQSFFKILALGLFDAVLTLPFILMNLIAEISQNEVEGFWESWDSIHQFITFIPTVTTEEWKSAGFWTVFSFRFSQWINVAFSIAFFVLFGLTEERKAWYLNLYRKVMRLFGRNPQPSPEASIIFFNSGPAINPRLNSAQVMPMASHSLSTSGSQSDGFSTFENAREIEEARQDKLSDATEAPEKKDLE